jgi:hypothetical protein
MSKEVKTLTQEEKIIKLAEAGGWGLFSEFKNLWAPPKHVVEYDCDAYPLPDYFHDLNAVHEFIMAQSCEFLIRYRNTLADFCGSQHYHNATAAQRCEAIGKTLNLW